MLRPGFLGITVVACVLGLASAWSDRVPLAPWAALASVLLAALAHGAANVLNDYEDARNGADAANTGALHPFTGGARLIQRGEVGIEATRRLAWALLALVVAGGLWLVLDGRPQLLPLGLAGLAIGWAYSAPPMRLMSRGLGEIAVALAWCLLVLGADLTQRGQLAATPLWVGASLGVLAAAILLGNGLPDASTDAQVGKRTLAVRLGADAAARLHLALMLLAHALCMGAAWALQRPALLAGLLTLPLGLWASLAVRRDAQTPQHLGPALAATIATAQLHGLALTVALLLARA